MTAPNHTCAGDIWRGFRYQKCGKTAAHEHEGVMYCKTHHPPTIEEKRKQKFAEYGAYANRREAIYKADAEAKAEMNRRAECFPDLLDALRQWANAEATNDAEELQNARSSRDAAIARATSKEGA